jgi:membrane AbrB-like protein
MTRRGIGNALMALAIGAVAGYACAWMRTPIPWMLGPLFTLAFLRVAGFDLGVPAPVRYGGQWIIGTSLGLYFTPQVVREVAGLWYLLLAGAVFAVAVGYVSALALARMAGLDRTTALFASVPGGAAEMAVLGERFARVDRVATARACHDRRRRHSGGLRCWAHGADPYVQGANIRAGALCC